MTNDQAPMTNGEKSKAETQYYLNYHGVRPVVIRLMWPDQKKAVVEVNGVPEVVDSGDLFATEREALLANVARCHKKITAESNYAAECFKRMAELPPSISNSQS
jgi:hypothetical protein